MSNVLFSIEDAKAIAKAQNSHWFEPSTLRFFNCRISEMVYSSMDGKTMFFVTSERYNSEVKRMYTVRKATLGESGIFDISTVGSFQGYASRSGAHKRAKRERLAVL